MKKVVFIATLLSGTWAHAGKPADPAPTLPDVDLSSTAQQAQGQAQGQGQRQAANAAAGAESASQSGANAVSGDSAARSDANATGGIAGAGASADLDASTRSGAFSGSGGNALSTEYRSNVRALSAVLPSVTGAQRGESECHEQRRGYAPIPGTGASGRTKINADCLALRAQQDAHLRCLDLFAALVEIGATATALRQLESCGAVPAAQTDIRSASQDYVTRDEMTQTVQRMFEASQAK